MEQEEGPQENGRRPRRPKKRTGRREKERQARRSVAAAKEHEADGSQPSAAFGKGFGTHDRSQAWAEGAKAQCALLMPSSYPWIFSWQMRRDSYTWYECLAALMTECTQLRHKRHPLLSCLVS